MQVLDGGRSLELRLPDLEPEQTQALIDQLIPLTRTCRIHEQLSVNTIGPTLGSQLLRSSAVSLLVSFALIAAYISFRYDGIYAALALLCLAHDVLITCGVFAWLGLLSGVEVDSLFAVALITVAGYSVNDTVVVFDRIREQRREQRDVSLSDQVDLAVDATAHSLALHLLHHPAAPDRLVALWRRQPVLVCCGPHRGHRCGQLVEHRHRTNPAATAHAAMSGPGRRRPLQLPLIPLVLGLLALLDLRTELLLLLDHFTVL